MKNIRNLILNIVLIAFAFLLFTKVSAEESFFYTEIAPNTSVSQNKLELWEIIKQDNLITPNTTLYKIREFFGLAEEKYPGPKPAIAYIKTIVNWLLWLVSFIALVVTIFAFYQIFFDKGEEGVAKAKKMMIGIMVALAIMWISRYIVSYFYDIYAITTGTNLAP